jgi:general secretion pathway protein A
MYERYYGLKERAFDLTPNPRFLYLTARHREALSNLQYGIAARKGITLLLGDAGTGKTTLLRAALDAQEGRPVQTVVVSNPALTRDEFIEYLAGSFELSPNASHSKTRFLFELTRTLKERHAAGVTMALMIDEAQSLPHALLEEIRLLANIETTVVKLLPVVLVGQPELSDRLNEPGLRQLKQRIALRCVLAPLDLRETGAYIANRLRIAGGNITNVFTREAVGLIHERSRGIPRIISVICDNALVTGFASEQRPVGRDVIADVCRDFDLGAPVDGARFTPVSADGAPARAAGLPAAGNGGRPTPAGANGRAAAAASADPGDREPVAVGAGPVVARPEYALFGHFTKRRRFSLFS